MTVQLACEDVYWIEMSLTLALIGAIICVGILGTVLVAHTRRQPEEEHRG